MPTADSDKLQVLWATDGSENARNAVSLIRQLVLPNSEKLTVLTVAPHAILSGARPDPAFLTHANPKAKERALDEAEAEARTAVMALDPASSQNLEVITRWGNPIEEILRLSRSIPAGLIVMSAKGHSNLRLALLGSVSQGVVQHTDRPTLIVRPGIGEADKALVGYDGSTPSKKALEFANRLAPASVAFHLVRVNEPFTVPEGMPVNYRRMALSEAHQINEKRDSEAERLLGIVAEGLRATGRTVTTEVLNGPAGPILDDAAQKQGADLIVVGSRKPSPARHYLLGSTAEKLVRHSRASVLVVR